MKSTLVVLISITCGLAAAHASADEGQSNGDAVIGKWFTEGHKSIVEITKHDNGKYYGKIAWMKEPVYGPGDPEAGKAKHDRENPDKSLRDRPAMGLPLLNDFSYNTDKKEWTGGTIYDPERGKTYKCIMRLEGKTLKVRGYIGTPILGRTTEWTRATKEDLKRIQQAKKDNQN